jgi:hypothetical protein
VASLGLPPRVAKAAHTEPATTPGELDAADRAALDESRRLYEEGKAKFDTVDFVGAIDLWTQAYARTPESAPGIRNAMVYNIATAREKAYELDGELQHLRQAILLLQSYVQSYQALYAKTPETEAEVSKARERIAQLQARIGAAERGESPAPAPNGSAAPGTLAHNHAIMWNSGHSPPPDPELVERNRKLAAEGKKTDAMLIAGYVVGSVGLLFLLGSAGAFGAGAALDEGSEDNAGQDSTTAGFVALGIGLGGVATGATLLGVGFSRRKKHQRGELTVAPALAPSFAGASLRLRF